VLFDGVADLAVLPDCDAVLSGYLGAAETGPVLLDIVARVKAANKRALYCCDPVIGDTAEGVYVRDGVPEFFRDRLLAIADVATPNRFELELLTGTPIDSLAAAVAAAQMLRRRGPATVLVTSLEPAPGRVAMLAVGAEGAFLAETPLLPLAVNGCGDVAAALFLGWLLRGKPLPAALADTMAGIHAVITATHLAGRRELALIAAQDELVSPSRKITPQRLG
jgi:pyridoxine kinase